MGGADDSSAKTNTVHYHHQRASRPHHIALFLILAFSLSCNSRKTVDLLTQIQFSERKPDTEVLLFATPKASELLSSWSEPQKQSGGRLRWTTSATPQISWNLSVPDPSFLHLRLRAMETFPVEVYAGNTLISRFTVTQSTVKDVIPLPEETTQVQLKLPPDKTLGAHSAIITRSRSVAEFRKPKEFPVIENLRVKGKVRKALFCETGGSINFFETISPDTVLEFGYYFVPFQAGSENEHANFSIYMTAENGLELKIFEKDVHQEVLRNIRIPLDFVKPAIYKLEFRLARNTAFGSTKTAWIEPRLHTTSGIRKLPNGATELRKSLKDSNIVLIVLDAAAQKHFGCYGYKRNTTPVIDGLAAQGVQFLRAYTNAVYTLASTTTLLTGQVPQRHGILTHQNKLPANAFTLPETMQRSGYETAVFLANGNASGSFGMTQGFKTVREVFRDKGYTGRGEEITRAFSNWLGKHNNRKFFAYLHYREPHDPYKPPEEWIRKFASSSYTGKIVNIFDQLRIRAASSAFSEADRDHVRALYDANLAYADSQVAEVLRSLQSLRIDHRTIVVVTSDHGEAFWEHGFLGHNRQVYEESARIPLVIKFPNNAGLSNRKVNFPVQTADLYVSLVDILGLSNRGIQTNGNSFVPYLKKGVPAAPKIVVHSSSKLLTALVLDDYKYVRNEKYRDELYNLRKDPFEQDNLINRELVRAGYLRKVLLMELDSKKAKPQKMETPQLDEAVRENLKALGYVEQ
ncbi:sulfatase [bacterium]|nr:sulfatase [bacterium]